MPYSIDDLIPNAKQIQKEAMPALPLPSNRRNVR